MPGRSRHRGAQISERCSPEVGGDDGRPRPVEIGGDVGRERPTVEIVETRLGEAAERARQRGIG